MVTPSSSLQPVPVGLLLRSRSCRTHSPPNPFCSLPPLSPPPTHAQTPTSRPGLTLPLPLPSTWTPSPRLFLPLPRWTSAQTRLPVTLGPVHSSRPMDNALTQGSPPHVAWGKPVPSFALHCPPAAGHGQPGGGQAHKGRSPKQTEQPGAPRAGRARLRKRMTMTAFTHFLRSSDSSINYRQKPLSEEKFNTRDRPCQS